MFKFFSTNKMTREDVDDIYKAVISAVEKDDDALAWRELAPLVEVQAGQKLAALGILDIVREGHMSVDKSQDLLTRIYDAHSKDDEVIGKIGLAMENARDIDDLNAPPPDLPLFDNVIMRLKTLSEEHKGTDAEASYIEGLATTCRLAARQYDDLADHAYARLVELHPQQAWAHYGQGLFFKTRGRFQEGVAANQKAISLAAEKNQAQHWNLGICATGSGNSEAALEVWQGQGQKIKHGRFDLPEGGYPSCKVKLAENPLAQRTQDNDYPGAEETIWAERLSPCHGIIRSVLYADLGVDYGDVVLFDGAPITTHTYGERQVSVFPHLATLRRRNYQFYDFAGTQPQGGLLSDISGALEKDAVVYSHTEQMKILCSGCWNNRELKHDHKKDDEKHVIFGRIAAPPDMSPKALLAQIDAALEAEPKSRIFSPSLCEAAGLGPRAEAEQRRYAMLQET